MQQRRAIFITGAASGIGRAIAQRFIKGHWFVGIGDTNEQGLQETETLLSSGFVYCHTFDVRDREAWDHALATFCTAAGGRIDALVNNAGVALGGRLDTLSDEEIDRTIETNFRGAVHGTRAAYPYLKATAPGSCLLNISSAAAIHGVPFQGVYGATKAALSRFTETLDNEWSAEGIRACSLMPGFVDTPMLAAPANARSSTLIRSEVIRAGLEFTPVEEVAEAAWLAVTQPGKVHSLIGKTARQLAFAARWMPERLRRRMKEMAASRPVEPES